MNKSSISEFSAFQIQDVEMRLIVGGDSFSDCINNGYSTEECNSCCNGGGGGSDYPI